MKKYVAVWVIALYSGCAQGGDFLSQLVSIFATERDVLNQLSIKCASPSATDSVSCLNKLRECRLIADGNTHKLTACAENPLYSDCKQFSGDDKNKTFACIENPTLMLENKKQNEDQEHAHQEQAEQDSRDALKLEEKQKTDALEALNRDAEQGNVAAQRKLATIFYNGDGVTQNYVKAEEWYLKAAKQGDVVAQFYLGVIFSNGQGVKQNYTKSVEWYRKSSEQGYSDSQNNLGVLYYNGQGVPKSYAKAAEWYRKSAKQGNSEAQKNLLITESAIQAEQQKMEVGQLVKNDEAHGYFSMSFEDYQLDAESMPVGKRVKISGYYEIYGSFQTLSAYPSFIIQNGYKVNLLTDGTPRDARKKLIEMQRVMPCGSGHACQATVLGHTVSCQQTYAGRKVRDTVCLAVDEIR